MFQLAIFKTLVERQRLAEVELKKVLPGDMQAHHSLFYKSVDVKTGLLRQPTTSEKVDRLSDLLKYHTKQVSREKILELFKPFNKKPVVEKPKLVHLKSSPQVRRSNTIELSGGRLDD